MAKRLTYYILGGLAARHPRRLGDQCRDRRMGRRGDRAADADRRLFLDPDDRLPPPDQDDHRAAGLLDPGRRASRIWATPPRSGRVGIKAVSLVPLRQPRLADPRPDPGQPAAAGRRARPAAPARGRRERASTARPSTSPSFVTHIFPESMIEAMAKNEILQIVVFSLFVGVAITAVGEPARPLVRAIEALVKVMLQITDYVMRFAPVAVFAAVDGDDRRARARRSSAPSAISWAASISGSSSSGCC